MAHFAALQHIVLFYFFGTAHMTEALVSLILSYVKITHLITLDLMMLFWGGLSLLIAFI